MNRVLHVAKDFALPIDLVTQTIGVLAKRGAGKSYTAAVLAEEMLGAALPVVIADPVGVFWGLRAAANGRDPGLPILIMGGDHGDVPLEPGSGEVVADLIVDERVSAVLDLSRLRKGEQTRFMEIFAERLYQRNRQALHLILDEADAFAPQRPMPGEQRLLGAIEDLVRRGRARGIGLTLVTQRAAVLNKNVLTQAQVLVTLRTIAPQDRDAIDAWVEVHGTKEQRRELMDSLAALPVGAAWWWSPGWPTVEGIFRRVVIRRRRTFDSSATPEVGTAAAAPKKLAAVDLEGIRKRIASTIERARASDPKELRRRVAELEHQLAAKVAPVGREKRVEVPVLKDAQIKRLETLAVRVESALKFHSERVVAAHATLCEVLGTFGRQVREINSAAAAAQHGPQPARLPAVPALSEATRPAPASRNAGDGKATVGQGGLRRMLEALAWRPEGLSTRQLGIRAGLSSRGGTFNTYLSRARSQGLLAGTADRLQVTAEGLAAMGTFDPPPVGEALRAFWLSELGQSGAARILRVLIERHPRSLGSAELAERAGLAGQGGTFNTYVSRLRALELVEGRGELRASDELFDAGAPHD
jgi:hypothetical protein